MDRIPFVMLFGIATSVELFHERLPRAASRCLHGVQVEVEQTSSILEKIFQKAVTNSGALLRLGPHLLLNLMERQQGHVQSVQSFVVALKVNIHYIRRQHRLTNSSTLTWATSTAMR